MLPLQKHLCNVLAVVTTNGVKQWRWQANDSAWDATDTIVHLKSFAESGDQFESISRNADKKYSL